MGKTVKIINPDTWKESKRQAAERRKSGIIIQRPRDGIIMIWEGEADFVHIPNEIIPGYDLKNWIPKMIEKSKIKYY
jgi:hypothetical protein